MGQILQRHLGPVQSLLAGQWTLETVSGEPAVCCPSCSCISDLDPRRIGDGGGVRYIWACPSPSCPYTEFVTLEAWAEEVVPA